MRARAGRGQVARTLALVGVFVGVLAAAPAARALEATVGCAQLQATLDIATNGSEITLNQLCTGLSFTLKPGISMTLLGTNGAGFDGTGAQARVLTGIGVANITLRNLIFRNSTDQTGAGGAVRLELMPGAIAEVSESHFNDNGTTTNEPEGISAGGALAVDPCFNCDDFSDIASVLTVVDSTFTENTADAGGAISANLPEVLVGSSEFDSNRALFSAGGAARIAATVTHLVKSDFDDNRAATFGGAVSILGVALGKDPPVTPSAEITSNRFNGNLVSCGGISALGGGLYATRAFEAPSFAMRMIENRFDTNTAGPNSEADCFVNGFVIQESSRKAGLPGEGPVGGGGAWFEDVSVLSVNDRYTNNVVKGTHGVGGGVGVQSVFSDASLVGHNLAVAGNRVVGSTESNVMVICGDCQQIEGTGEIDPDPSQSFDRGIGGGIFAGGGAPRRFILETRGAGTSQPPSDGARATLIRLLDSTVAGNHVPFSGSGNGIGSDSEENHLDLANSIVFTAGTANDIAGIDIGAVAFSDACSDTNTPAGPAADGNICTDPLLVNPEPGTADVHETAQSPTLDKGSNALISENAYPFIIFDYEIDDRRLDADGNGVAEVDMGADEAPGKEPTCPGDPSCHEGPLGDPTCEDGKDNDGNGQTDGDDPKCKPGEEGPPGDETCSDGKDNDKDGDIDGDDKDCVDVKGEKLPPTGVGGIRWLLALGLLGGAAGLTVYERRHGRGRLLKPRARTS